jgi:hypothetical protein
MRYFALKSRCTRGVPVASLLIVSSVLPVCAETFATDGIWLRFVTSTRTQIVLGWSVSGDEAPVGFELQRSLSSDFLSPTTLTLPPDVNFYSDTGFSPTYKLRLKTTNLDYGVVYHYRIRAEYESSYSDYSNTVVGSLRYPVRGERGDLFADIVLGQPDFGQNSRCATTPEALDMGGGIFIDTTSSPERGYFVDANHNRILGFADIHASPLYPDIVIGQPDFISSAPNGDATVQNFPEFPVPSASTLALIRPDQVSVGEAVLTNQLDVDTNHALYVADVSNHRVLKYDDPFTTDTVADDVWGQPDFSTRENNYGGISNQSLRFMEGHTSAGVTIAPDGSLWVADSGNCRVLRFPYVSGEISKSADLVLGQPNFASSSGPWHPTSIQVEVDGTVYVAELQHTTGNPSRILVYEPPLSNGMAPSGELAANPTVRRPNYLFFDPLDRGIWVQNIEDWVSTTKLLDLSDGHVIYTVNTSQARGLGVDSTANVYVHVLDDGIYRYPSPYSDSSKTFIFEEGAIYSGRDFWQVKGVTTFRDQLIVAEAERLLIWDDVENVASYDHADDLWGQTAFDVNDTYNLRSLAHPTVDPKNRLWVFGYFRDGGLELRFRAFEYPLSHDSVPVKELGDTFQLVDYTGSVTTCQPSEWFNFDLTDGGDQMWIGDWLNHRVLRINNVDGGNDSERGPYVDVVLGQPDATSTLPNQGGAIGADTMREPRHVTVSPEGHLYVSDNAGEGGTNRRILIFDASLFPDDLDHVLYAVPASAILGTEGNFTVEGCVDETCDPYEASFNARGHMVCGMGPYSPNGQRFPLVYLDPFDYGHPQMALGDFSACPIYSYIDEQGNLYLADGCWARLLIYRQPFLLFDEIQSAVNRVWWSMHGAVIQANDGCEG